MKTLPLIMLASLMITLCGTTMVMAQGDDERPPNFYMNLLQNEIDPYTVSASAESLSELDSREDVDRLLRELSQANKGTGHRGRLVERLGDLGKQIIQDTLSLENSLSAACESVEHIGDPLMDIVEDGDESMFIRIKAVRALGKMRYVHAVDMLLDYIRYGNPDMRLAVIIALGQIGDRYAVEDIIERLEYDRDEQVRIAACGALANLGDLDASIKLEQILNNLFESVTLRAEAADALRHLEDPESLISLMRASINSNNRLITINSIKAIGRILKNENVQDYNPDRDSNSQNPVLRAVQVLREFIVTQEESKQMYGFIAAVAMLHATNQDEYRGTVSTGLSHENGFIRRQVLQAIMDLGIEDIEMEVEERLKDEDPNIAIMAAQYLIEKGYSREDLERAGFKAN